jgi:hypothetical protein
MLLVLVAGCSRESTTPQVPPTEARPHAAARSAPKVAEPKPSVALRSAINEVIQAGTYDVTRTRLRAAIKQDPNDRDALLQLAFLAWGFDRFDHEAWEESETCARAVLAAEPGNELAAEVAQQNGAHEPFAPPTATGGISKIVCRNAPIQFYGGQPSLWPGQTGAFDAKGALLTLDENGTHYKRVKGGWIFADQYGNQYMYMAPKGLGAEAKLGSLTSITQARRGLLR